MRVGSASGDTTGRRHVSRPWWSRVSAAHVLLAVLGLGAFAVNLAILGSDDQVTLVAVAATDLNPGVVLEPDDHVEYVELDAQSDLVERLVSASEVETYRGRIVARPVDAGEPLTVSALQVAAAPLEQRAISIALPRDRAVGGRIAPGDRVDVIAVTDGVARYVLAGTEVLETAAASGSGGIGGGAGYFIVVSVTADEALEVVSAMDTGSLDVVLSTGAVPPGALTFDPGVLQEQGDG